MLLIENAEFITLEAVVVACLTDEFIVGDWKDKRNEILEKQGRLLEVRVFNKDLEIKCFRSDIGKDFKERIRKDDGDINFFDQKQIIDIDTKRSNDFECNSTVISTGGGIFELPVDDIENVSILIRHYYRRNEETGQAEVYDWRAVEFVKGDQLCQ